MNGAEDDIVQRLTAIGLDEREAKLYVDLLLHGASRASDAAARVRLKRTETYRALEALMKRGFVTAQLTRPVQYEALAPDAVFRDLLARHESTRDEMERLREQVAEMAARTRADDAEGRHGYRIIQSRRAILSAVETMMRSARDRFDMATTYLSPAVATPTNRAYQAMLRRVGEGMPLRLLVREYPNFDRTLQPLLQHRHVEIRYGDIPQGVRFAIADNKEIIFWLVSDPAVGVDAREDVAMWTNAADFIEAQQLLFEACWQNAKKTLRAGAAPAGS